MDVMEIGFIYFLGIVTTWIIWKVVELNGKRA
jgi:hypothetical protein